MKRSTLYTIVILLSLAYFTPGFASIDPENSKQEKAEGEAQEGTNQEEEGNEGQEQEQTQEESSQGELEDPTQPIHSVDLPESQLYETESTEPELNVTPIREPAASDSDYFEMEEEDTSESVINFNFLYYLLQKFKVSDSEMH